MFRKSLMQYGQSMDKNGANQCISLHHSAESLYCNSTTCRSALIKNSAYRGFDPLSGHHSHRDNDVAFWDEIGHGLWPIWIALSKTGSKSSDVAEGYSVGFI